MAEDATDLRDMVQGLKHALRAELMEAAWADIEAILVAHDIRILDLYNRTIGKGVAMPEEAYDEARGATVAALLSASHTDRRLLTGRGQGRPQ